MADTPAAVPVPVPAAAAAAPAADAPEDYTLKNPDTVTKYRTAGDIANRALKAVVDAAVAGAKVLDLCAIGDKIILEASQSVYRKSAKDGAKIERGIAFPTCVSLNECVCHQSPLNSDKEIVLQAGDLVKVELGVHIDGLPTMVATSLVVGATKDAPVTGRKADVLLAAHTAAEVAIRVIRAGAKSSEVVQAVDKILAAYKVKGIEGISSYIAKRNTLEGDKHFTQVPSEANRKDADVVFAEGDVYNVDIIVSSGAGKPKQLETRTTVYRRTETSYMLKMKASRMVFSEIQSKFGVFAFTLRALEDEGKGRLGIKECAEHALVTPYDVLYEKEGEVTAQLKFAVLLLPNGTSKVTTPLFDPLTAKSENAVTDESVLAILAQAATKKKTNKKKKSAKKPAAGAAAGAPAGAADGDDDADEGDEE